MDKQLLSACRVLAMDGHGNGIDRMGYVQNSLFETGGFSSARAFHECKDHQVSALRWLRSQRLPKVAYERQHKGARLAPAIEVLRNGWGFDILGNGSIKQPYYLADKNQYPSRVHVTTQMEAVYYASEHWVSMRTQRFELDKYSCVLCTVTEPAAFVHHVKYALFNESLDELISVCERHHKMIHDNSRIGFPIGCDVSIAEKLLGVPSYSFEDWLLPLGGQS
jgi:hypothetical protein